MIRTQLNTTYLQTTLFLRGLVQAQAEITFMTEAMVNLCMLAFLSSSASTLEK
jgi:hypothetical protein